MSLSAEEQLELWQKILVSAAKQGEVRAVGAALQRGADPNKADSSGWTPLHLAAEGGHTECVSALLDAGACPCMMDSQGHTPLRVALQNGCHACVDAFVIRGLTLLHDAATCGNVARIRELLEGGEDVNVKTLIGMTPLHFAAQHGHDSCVRVLAEKGASIDETESFGQTPLHFAAQRRRHKCVVTLLEKGARLHLVDCNGSTPLHRAALGGSVECVQALLDGGAPLDVVDKEGNRPLHVARDAQCVALLEAAERSDPEQPASLEPAAAALAPGPPEGDIPAAPDLEGCSTECSKQMRSSDDEVSTAVGTGTTQASSGSQHLTMMDFGQYFGHEPATVYATDPGYVKWALDNAAHAYGPLVNFIRYCQERKEEEAGLLPEEEAAPASSASAAAGSSVGQGRQGHHEAAAQRLDEALDKFAKRWDLPLGEVASVLQGRSAHEQEIIFHQFMPLSPGSMSTLDQLRLFVQIRQEVMNESELDNL